MDCLLLIGSTYGIVIGLVIGGIIIIYGSINGKYGM
jgi:hypothetical protein